MIALGGVNVNQSPLGYRSNVAYVLYAPRVLKYQLISIDVENSMNFNVISKSIMAEKWGSQEFYDEEQPSNKARRVARACLQVRPNLLSVGGLTPDLNIKNKSVPCAETTLLTFIRGS
ncbi:uncharacterized protein TRUGW13939_09258 [Talaromyces rugulosus]|uniref:Uncharacterized protein n=1 Tax=Talaromyces rugulosus TaxID=121627 RepID=A0A7H8R6W0_TALRU|nr:uncharacterized protein TRUGW13939_09258 [Talaromyces rugulosus]QKX62102.1 hypothetical protein TRUGW13939_09258 [Talaromyces rugulosus]